jgi:hypothetical protein
MRLTASLVAQQPEWLAAAARNFTEGQIGKHDMDHYVEEVGFSFIVIRGDFPGVFARTRLAVVECEVAHSLRRPGQGGGVRETNHAGASPFLPHRPSFPCCSWWIVSMNCGNSDA